MRWNLGIESLEISPTGGRSPSEQGFIRILGLIPKRLLVHVMLDPILNRLLLHVIVLFGLEFCCLSSVRCSRSLLRQAAGGPRATSSSVWSCSDWPRAVNCCPKSLHSSGNDHSNWTNCNGTEHCCECATRDGATKMHLNAHKI